MRKSRLGGPKKCPPLPSLGGGGLLSLVLAVGCAEPSVSKSPDPTRALSPVPACVQRLPASSSKSEYARSLPEAEYWGLVVPKLRKDIQAVQRDTLACNGQQVFESEAFEGATLNTSAIDDGLVMYGGGANRIKVVWLRTHLASDGQAAGPLAILRTVEDIAEVYGVGAFRGDPDRVRFDLERLGGEIVVTAVSDGCQGNSNVDCSTDLEVFRPVDGRLDRLAVIQLQKVRHATNLEPGVMGNLKFELTSSPEYASEGIHLVEEVSVSDESGRKVRRAQLERSYIVEGSEVRETRESLWKRLYSDRVAGQGNSVESSTAPENQGGPQ